MKDYTSQEFHKEIRNTNDTTTLRQWVREVESAIFDIALADIIRVDDFVVEAHITCQRLTDQRGRRYRDRFTEENAVS